MSRLPFIRKRFRFFGAASPVLGLLPAACLLAGCAPSPQYRGQLIIMNCTETVLSVQSNLNCPNGDYPVSVSISPGKSFEIASTDKDEVYDLLSQIEELKG